MNLFSLLFLIPQVFTVGKDIVDCLDGDVDQATWNRTVDNVYDLATKVPEIQGIIALNQGLFNLAKIMFPFMMQMLSQVKTEKPADLPMKMKVGVNDVKMQGMIDDLAKFIQAAKEISEDELVRAYNSVKLLSDVADKMVEEKKVPKKELDDDSIVKYYESEFNTATFFDNQQNG